MTTPALEWLEADGLGGFASGTASLARTRRYHALLMRTVGGPSKRFVLVNGLDARVRTPEGEVWLSSQCYGPDLLAPDGASHVVTFTSEPWPAWVFRLPGGQVVRQEIFVPRDRSATVITWKLVGDAAGCSLEVRPFFSGRDPHSTHHENGSFNFTPGHIRDVLRWQAYDGVPPVAVKTNGAYTHDPHWYRNFHYSEEAARGLDASEDLAAPGFFTWNLSDGEAVFILGSPEDREDWRSFHVDPPLTVAEAWRKQERTRRNAYASPVHRAADDYLVRRGQGLTIIAGYPWFTDWGRDTFIALRGLCLAAGQLDAARSILMEWSGVVSEGMLPNFFPDGAAKPEYNSVDASLWYIIAVHDYLEARLASGASTLNGDLRPLLNAIEEILEGYSAGTRFGIRADSDGLLFAGQHGVQLTWMDAKVGDWVVTPRMGKPVEVQALWINALRIGAKFNVQWRELADRALASFRAKFWNAELNCLYDVVDLNFLPGRTDAAIRPNQIFAVGGLPIALLEGEQAASVVRIVEEKLLTPLGLRSLAPSDPAYTPRYEGGVRERDGAYHQGTVWPWLIGGFVEAWMRVRGGTDEAREEAVTRFIAPLRAHLLEAGLGHISEIADAEAPHTPRGCPFQAWSLGELIRLEAGVLKAPVKTISRKAPKKTLAKRGKNIA